jgi:LysM repeat protein
MIRLQSLLNEGNGPLTGKWLDTGVGLAKLLIARGFSKEAASAIVGNMWAESTFNPAASNAIGAFGLLQWLGDRKKELIKFANSRKMNPNSLKTQLDFIKYELLDAYDGEYAYEANQFKKAMASDTVTGKAYAFAKFVERPNSSELTASASSRKIAAKNVYDVLTGIKPKKTAATTLGKASTKKSSKKQYTVKQGETLGGIANRNKTTIDAILKKNKGLKANKIAVGQKLYI